MSNTATYTDFCTRYELNQSDPDSKKQYDKYCKNLSLFREMFDENNQLNVIGKEVQNGK